MKNQSKILLLLLAFAVGASPLARAGEDAIAGLNRKFAEQQASDARERAAEAEYKAQMPAPIPEVTVILVPAPDGGVMTMYSNGAPDFYDHIQTAPR